MLFLFLVKNKLKMGQDNVYKQLKRNKNDWFSSKDISKITGSNTGSVRKSLNALLKAKDIEMKIGEAPIKKYLWRFK